MDFSIPPEIESYLKELDAFIEREIKPLEQPQREQRLHDEPARKGIEAEQGRELIDNAARRAERG